MADSRDRTRGMVRRAVSSALDDRIAELERRRTSIAREEYEQLEAERRLREDRDPILPRQWIENEYFSGYLARDMYDPLKEHFADVFEKNYFEVVMGGAIGYGKTTLALTIHLYSLYLLSCYGIPQRAFRGMVESAQILMLNLNTTKQKAKNSYFKDLMVLARSIPYFQNDFVPQKNLINEMRFNDKRIMCTFGGATKTAAESEHLILCVLDEANLYDVVEKSRRAEGVDEKYDEAAVVYAAATRRMQTRFMLPDGSMPLPCKLITLCKETYPNSFIRRRVKEARDQGEIEKCRTKVIEYAEWETKPEGTYEKSYFWIKTGTRTESPKVIEDEQEATKERQLQERRKAEGAHDDETCEVIQVPRAGGEYVMLAKKALPEFIRDVCGRATESLKMFFHRREPIFRARRIPGPSVPAAVCDHPYSSEWTTFFDGAFLMKEKLAEQVEGVWRPLVEPGMSRFVHVDTGLTNDAAGFAMGCPHGWKDVVRLVGGESKMERLPGVWYDMLLRILPPRGEEIPYAAIRGLIYSLAELGFRIAGVTYDSYQRSWAQELDFHGYPCELLSMDTSMDPYVELRTAYMENRVSVYSFPFVEGELGGLEEVYTGRVKDGKPVKKVDHPPGESKDVADAMAGVCWQIVEWARAGQMTAPMGVKGPERVTVGEKEEKKRKLYREGKFEELYEMMKRDEEVW